MDRRRLTLVLAVGLLAGVASGFLGVGGGIVIVPMLVWLLTLDHHHAHATSLAAIVIIATVAAATYVVEGEARFAAAWPLAVGAVIGAPLGARIMKGTSDRNLGIAFGVLQVVVGAVLVLT